MSPKNPRTPPSQLLLDDDDICIHDTATPLFRIHTVHGQHPMAWNDLRNFGPLTQMRWDPHPPPVGMHSGIGVAYCATDSTTAFAEVFQSRRVIRLNSNQALSAWFPSRDLRLLDLTGLWGARNNASASLHAAPKSTCRAWAQAIHAQFIERGIDGLYVPSTMTLKPLTVLFSASQSAFPTAPHFAELLTHSAVRVLAHRAARTLRWSII